MRVCRRREWYSGACSEPGPCFGRVPSSAGFGESCPTISQQGQEKWVCLSHTSLLRSPGNPRGKRSSSPLFLFPSILKRELHGAGQRQTPAPPDISASLHTSVYTCVWHWIRSSHPLPKLCKLPSQIPAGWICEEPLKGCLSRRECLTQGGLPPRAAMTEDVGTDFSRPFPSSYLPVGLAGIATESASQPSSCLCPALLMLHPFPRCSPKSLLSPSPS